MVDTLAHGGEEGRDKLRKAAGSRKWAVIRRCPNGATQSPQGGYHYHVVGRTGGTETSKYPQEEKTKVIP